VPDRLAQAVRNLVGNAIDHTAGQSGLVRMRVERGDADSVRFIVEDDGPGIPPEERELVFHRFHRSEAARSRSASGTGLGLAIVRAIADAPGGTVRASESSEGGTRIELELPGYVPGREAPLGAARREAEPAAAASAVADDEPVVAP